MEGIAPNHFVDELWGDVIYGDFSGAGLVTGVSGASTVLGMVRLFLLTISGTVSFFETVEAGVVVSRTASLTSFSLSYFVLLALFPSVTPGRFAHCLPTY